MPVTIVAGAQWGDEGKGKIVDLLAQSADMVIRCQGGPNGGHTIVNQYGKFALHTVPSGIFAEGACNVLAPGVVINPMNLAAEIDGLNAAGIDTSRLLISERAHLVLPYHCILDQLQDNGRPADLRIGSTGQGVGPAYADKAARIGIRAGDLRNRSRLADRIALALGHANAVLRTQHGHDGFTVDEVTAALEPCIDRLLPSVGDTAEPIHQALANDQAVLLEGQLGVMRDLDWGTYPFVTSSYPTPAGMAAAAGIPPQAIARSIGVAKAYTTSVGESPFPTELTGEEAARIRTIGGEFGATTGRPRRCGYLDLPALWWACSIAGFTDIALTKLDILPEGLTVDNGIPVCTHYRRDGRLVSPYAASFDLSDVAPVYELRPSWTTPISEVRKYENLPAAARAYVEFIERRTACPIHLISVGPEREATIVR